MELQPATRARNRGCWAPASNAPEPVTARCHSVGASSRTVLRLPDKSLRSSSCSDAPADEDAVACLLRVGPSRRVRSRRAPDLDGWRICRDTHDNHDQRRRG